MVNGNAPQRAAQVKNGQKPPENAVFGPFLAKKSRFSAIFNHRWTQIDTDGDVFLSTGALSRGIEKANSPGVPPQAGRQPPRSTTPPKSVSIGVHPWLFFCLPSPFAPVASFVVKAVPSNRPRVTAPGYNRSNMLG